MKMGRRRGCELIKFSDNAGRGMTGRPENPLSILRTCGEFQQLLHRKAPGVQTQDITPFILRAGKKNIAV